MRGKITIVDWAMLALAILSVGLLLYETLGDPTPQQTRQILLADLVIVGIFAVEFAIRWAKDSKPKTFLARYWYDLLGMIPVAHPVVRGFRLFRVVRIIVLLSRFGRAADRAFGAEFTARLLGRSKDLIVEVIGDAITVRVLDETLSVLQKGAYTRNLADHIEKHGAEADEIIQDTIRRDPQLGRLRHLPFFEDIVAGSSRVAQRVLVNLLRDPRLDQMVKDVIAQNVQQIRHAVSEKEALQQLRRRGNRGATGTPS
jgi:voltage-gated potassium channel